MPACDRGPETERAEWQIGIRVDAARGSGAARRRGVRNLCQHGLAGRVDFPVPHRLCPSESSRLADRLAGCAAQRGAGVLLWLAQTTGSGLYLASRRRARFDSPVPGRLCAVSPDGPAGIFPYRHVDPAGFDAAPHLFCGRVWPASPFCRLGARGGLRIFSVEGASDVMRDA